MKNQESKQGLQILFATKQDVDFVNIGLNQRMTELSIEIHSRIDGLQQILNNLIANYKKNINTINELYDQLALVADGDKAADGE